MAFEEAIIRLTKFVLKHCENYSNSPVIEEVYGIQKPV